MSEVLERNQVGQIAPGDAEPEDVTHIVSPADAVTEAYIMGTEVKALCGHVFVPTRDPFGKPKCRPCVEVMNNMQELRGRI